MQYIQSIALTFLLFFYVTSTNAEPSCLELVKQLDKRRNIISSNGGMWGYFERVPKLRARSVEAIQLDSRINKIFFALGHLCATENGIPLNDLATYIGGNVSEKGINEFKSELLLLGKTPQQIKIWFEFYHYAQKHKSRTLKISKIHNALDKSTLYIEKYTQLAEGISRGDSPEIILEKTRALNFNIDILLTQQPYLTQALEEISHFPYWDINESTGGS